MAIPTLEEFRQACREAFAFLSVQYSFAEVPPFPHDYENPFTVCFSNGALKIIVEGISYGSSAAISFEDRLGRRASFDYLLSRELPAAEVRFGQPGQVALVHHQAQYLERFGRDLLEGDMADFEWMVEEDIHRRRESEQVETGWRYQRASEEANAAFSQGNYRRVVELLSGVSTMLSGSQQKKLEYARKRC